MLLGIDNAVVVDTPDALLVGDLNRSQEVRDIVDELSAKAWALTLSNNHVFVRSHAQ